MDNTKYIKELVGIKSFDTTENKEIIDYLQTAFGKYTKNIIRVKNAEDDRENLIIGINTPLENINDAIVLAGHIDTVEANLKEYNTNPFVATTKSDRIYGLGSIDMKSFFASILNNVEYLKTKKVPIIVAITGDEETNFYGVNTVFNTLKQLNIVPRFSVIGEPTNSKICYISKSCFKYEITVSGKACHSSMPENGINANYILARIALYIEKLCKQYYPTTMTANIISGGTKVNIVSDSARLVYDLRSTSLNKCNEVQDKMLQYLKRLKRMYKGCEISLKCSLQILPLENKNYGLIKTLCEKLGVSTADFTGGCEAGYYQNLGGNAIIFGVGDLSLAHKPNEFVSIPEFNSYQQKLMSLIDYLESPVNQEPN